MGVDFRLLTAPVKILGDDRGWVTVIECIKMELGEPDESGRRKPIPVHDSNFVLDVNIVVMAIVQGPNPLVQDTPRGLL